MLDSLAAAEREKTKDLLGGTKFISLTCDGTTDVTGREQECLYLRFSTEGQITQRFLCFGTPSDTTAGGIFSFITAELRKQGGDHLQSPLSKLVGFGSDGAANMMGVRSGVGVRLKELHPNLVLVKCLAHRLESCSRDATRDIKLYDKSQMLLIGLYYLYKKSPKQRQQLLQAFDFSEMKGGHANQGWRNKVGGVIRSERWLPSSRATRL